MECALLWLSSIVSVEDEKGKVCSLELRGVSFWVNLGGQNWSDFEILKVVRKEDGKELKFSTGIEATKNLSKEPFVLVEGNYKLTCDMNSGLQNVGFVQQSKKATSAVPGTKRGRTK